LTTQYIELTAAVYKTKFLLFNKLMLYRFYLFFKEWFFCLFWNPRNY